MMPRREPLWPSLLLGVYLGVVFTKAEVISWFRIQEMFRFQSFHMYGIMASAVAVAAAGTWVVRTRGMRTMTGGPIEMTRVPWLGVGAQYWLGGALFGMGWAMTGACPGPMFALVGTGLSVMLVAMGAALAGVWTYGWLRPRLPH
jgi:uncharacterized membrane protein YedE/YeeE